MTCTRSDAPRRPSNARSNTSAQHDTLRMLMIDKADVAGALRRREMRAWVCGLDPAKRNAMLVAGEFSAEVVLALLELPAEIIDLGDRQ